MSDQHEQKHHELLEIVMSLSRSRVTFPIKKGETGADQWNRVLKEAHIDVFNPYRDDEDIKWWELLRIWDTINYQLVESYLQWEEWVKRTYPVKEVSAL